MRHSLRRQIVALMAVTSLVAVSCGSPDEGTSSTSPGSVTSSTSTPETTVTSVAPVTGDEPQFGGTGVIALDGDPEHLLTAAISGTRVGMVGSKIYEGLLTYDRDYNQVPLLATEWETSEDGKQVTFRLREGVRWHDGEPFTSADVKFTYEEVVANHPSRATAAMQEITSIDTPDDHTVVFNFDEPYGPFLLLVTNIAGILPKHIFEGTDVLDNPAAQDTPVGTGPFMMEEWVRGQSITLVRNDDYWNAPQPYLDRVVFSMSPDPQGRVAAFEAGEVDYLNFYFLSVAAWQRLAEQEGVLSQREATDPYNTLLIPNHSREPLDDPIVRRALMHAIDVDLMIEVTSGGLDNRAKSAITPALSWAYNPEVDLTELYPYDPDKAAALLDELGYMPDANGVRFTWTLNYDAGNAVYPSYADVIIENLRQIGIEIEAIATERAVNLEQVFGEKDFDLTLQQYSTKGDPTVGIERLYTSRYLDQGNFSNVAGWSNPEVDELFQQAGRASDLEERAEYLYPAQEILAEELPVLVLIDNFSGDVASAGMHGIWFEINAGDSNWAHVWREQSG